MPGNIDFPFFLAINQLRGRLILTAGKAANFTVEVLKRSCVSAIFQYQLCKAFILTCRAPQHFQVIRKPGLLWLTQFCSGRQLRNSAGGRSFRRGKKTGEDRFTQVPVCFASM